jgi:hypothetical protein
MIRSIHAYTWGCPVVLCSIQSSLTLQRQGPLDPEDRASDMSLVASDHQRSHIVMVPFFLSPLSRYCESRSTALITAHLGLVEHCHEQETSVRTIPCTFRRTRSRWQQREQPIVLSDGYQRKGHQGLGLLPHLPSHAPSLFPVGPGRLRTAF